MNVIGGVYIVEFR